MAYISTLFFAFVILIASFESFCQVKVGKLNFSHPHGIYSEPFTLSVSSNFDSAEIKYTLDGSDPIKSSTAVTGTNSVSVTIDPSLTENRDNAPGFIITVCALEADSLVSKVVSQTYLFVNQIIELSPDGKTPGDNWLEPWTMSQQISYGLDPDVYNNSKYSSQIEDAFLAIPSISIITDLGNLFDPDSGIYVNATMHGIEWERRASVELINPDGSEGFQENCGIRIRGGWSRHNENPKHAFRLFFRNEYGAGKLNYSLFGSEGADEFDKIDLRTAQNYSWSYYGDSRNTFLRDVFSRDLQKDMKQPYTRSRFYHLFINGTYWGLFQSQERAEANYGETYFGGSNEDYDVIKVDTGEDFNLYKIEATDGTLDKWKELWDAAELGLSDNESYFKIQGLNTDGTPNPAYEKLLDVDNIIDYMITIFFTGDFDAPVSNFRGNNNPNNFYGIYNRINPDGFKFFRHDAEHTLFHFEGTDRTGPYPAGQNFGDSNPQWIHQKLSANSNYRLRFSDRVYKHFYNNGALTLDRNLVRINKRKNEIETAIIAESARWGDSKSSSPLTKDNWINEVNFILEEYLPGRNEVVLGQLIDKELFHDLLPPQFNVHGGKVDENFLLELSSSSGEIYYTTNGADPYSQFLGEVSSDAIKYELPVQLTSTTKVKSRLFNNDSWSALNEAVFIINQDLTNFKVTELHYHPADHDTINDTEYEFIEFKNTGSEEINLNTASIVDGISFTFTEDAVIQPGGFLVLASNKEEFNNRYGFYPYDEYEQQLDNSGERIVLVDGIGDTIINFSYSDDEPWPIEADGDGYSLVSAAVNPTGDPNEASYWRISGVINGSPGADDIASPVEEYRNNLPVKFELFQNYPNPFNPVTKIKYSIPVVNGNFTSTINVKLKIYDILGNEVALLINEEKSPGSYEIKFDASSLTSGIYFYNIKAGSFNQTRKMLLLK